MFKTLPRRGKIAWIRESRPSLAEPAAELPSTINNSHSSALREEQSANLDGRLSPSKAPFLMTLSLAARAALRARAAKVALPTIFLAMAGFSSR